MMLKVAAFKVTSVTSMSDEPRFAECQLGRHLVDFDSVNRKPVNRLFFG